MFKKILNNLPEVKGPLERRLNFSTKLKWTLIILIFYFILFNIPLYGLDVNALKQFEYLSMIMGTSFGSIISLGIGPIVTASIILQLLVGSKLIGIDLTKPEGRRLFQGLQKLLAIAFCLLEASIFVLMRGLQAKPGFEVLLIIQLFLGGLLIIFMDEVVSKWGFGSGVSLFIVASVSVQLFTRAFGFFRTEAGTLEWSGRIPVMINAFISGGNPDVVRASAVAILATVAIFFLVIYTQGIKVEIPLSFGRIRGLGLRWPLSFFYTSVIPVILVSALMANIQLGASLLERAGKIRDASALTPWITGPGGREGFLNMVLAGSAGRTHYFQALVYLLIMVCGSALFSLFWMRTAGMDPASQAEQLSASGLQIPGFRQDPRIIETILARYIMPLTIMGGAGIGLLAALADLGGALVRGTGILLAVMIIYKLYEEIAQQHALDMHPIARKLMA